MINTTQNLSAEMQTYYEKTLIDNAEPKLVYDNFADKYPIPKNNGKTVQFRKFSPLQKATQAITEGVSPQGKQFNVTPSTATVEQFGDFIALTDVLQLTAIDNTIVQLSKILGAQAGRTLDTITRDVVCNGTNVIYAKSDKGEITLRENLDETCKLNTDIFFKAATQLAAMNADTIDDSYVAIIHPYAAYDIMSSPEWIDIHKYAKPENIYNGEIGKIGNVRFVKSTEAKIFKSPNLADTRTLKLKSITGTEIKLQESLTQTQLDALEGRIININDDVVSITSAVSPDTIIINKTITAKAGDTIYPSETGKKGLACFATMVLGAHAYATTEIEGGGLTNIIKNNGYGDDPLNQRASVGWKATKAVKRLVEEFMVRIESVTDYSATVEEN